MDSILPWEKWVKEVEPYYSQGKRGRKPQEIETMLRMLMLQAWFNLSDEGVEDAIYDSYAMRTFMGLDFWSNRQVPDATTLCRFRKLLNEHDLQKAFFEQVQQIIAAQGMEVRGGSIVDATIIQAPDSTRNAQNKRLDEEMHSTRKGNQYYYGARLHIGTDPVHGFVHHAILTPANLAENKIAPNLLRNDDISVYGDAGDLGIQNYDQLSAQRQYHICRQRRTFIRHHGDGLSWQIEKKLESRKASVRCKIEYVFHIIKDIFAWRKTRYRGIAKNQSFAYLLLASANLYMLAGMHA